MATVAVTLAAIKNLLKTYPALSAALVNVGVVAAGYFGLHVTPVQLVSFAGVLDVLFGMIVHSNVIPVAKTENTFTVVNPSILTAGRSGPVPGDPVPVETVPNAIVPMESYRSVPTHYSNEETQTFPAQTPAQSFTDPYYDPTLTHDVRIK